MTVNTPEFAREQTGKLLQRLIEFAEQAADDPTEDSVHDLRVTIRRFKAAMRVFRPMFDHREVKKIKRKLDIVMDAAGGVRDRDIALELLAKAGIPEQSPLVQEFHRQRVDARKTLQQAASTMVSKKWSWLGL